MIGSEIGSQREPEIETNQKHERRMMMTGRDGIGMTIVHLSEIGTMTIVADATAMMTIEEAVLVNGRVVAMRAVNVVGAVSVAERKKMLPDENCAA